MLNQYLISFVNDLTHFTSHNLVWIMFFIFSVCLVLKFCIYYTLKFEWNFLKQVEKTVNSIVLQFHSKSIPSNVKNNFELLTHTIFNIAYKQMYTNRRRRTGDTFVVAPLLERVFLSRYGAKNIIDDLNQQTRYSEHFKKKPDFEYVSEYVLTSNKPYNRLFGIFSINPIIEFLNILPALLIIGGIFGTFIGVWGALPELKGMNIDDMEMTKLTMNNFLEQISFALNTSIVGIMLSVLFNVINTYFSTDLLKDEIFTSIRNSLSFIWSESQVKIKTSLNNQKRENLLNVINNESETPFVFSKERQTTLKAPKPPLKIVKKPKAKKVSKLKKVKTTKIKKVATRKKATFKKAS